MCVCVCGCVSVTFVLTAQCSLCVWFSQNEVCSKHIVGIQFKNAVKMVFLLNSYVSPTKSA